MFNDADLSRDMHLNFAATLTFMILHWSGNFWKVSGS